MVINVGAFSADEVRKELNRCAKVRKETLDRCYAITGYIDLPTEEKAKVYDKVKMEVENKTVQKER